MLRAFLENERGIKRFLSKFMARAQDVDDLAQETFLRAFAAEAVHDVIAPRAFLYRVARNLALNEKARLANTLTDSMEDSADPDVLGSSDQVGGEEIVHSRRKMAMFAEAVSTLPPQCRRVFMLRKVHGLSQAQIAERIGISASTVEKHIATGLLKCRDYLLRHGYDDIPAAGGTAQPHAGRDETSQPDRRAWEGQTAPTSHKRAARDV
jgi:RNA polymerase sigma-70 factor (ECF subfamily)